MRKRKLSTRDGRGGPGARLGMKAVTAVATFSLVASMCPGAAALAFASEQVAAGAAGLESQGGAAALTAQAKDGTAVTNDTHVMKTGTYRVTGDVTIGPDRSGNGIRVEKGAKVLLEIAEGATLTVTGKDADANGVGRAAILLPEGSTLTVTGAGTLNATGGKASDGANGSQAGGSQYGVIPHTGNGGDGGSGGGGAGAGIGTDGGAGGKGGGGGAGVWDKRAATSTNRYGNDGDPGSDGAKAAPAGAVVVTGSATVIAKGGACGSGGTRGGRGWYAQKRDFDVGVASGTSGGGAGGGGGSAADGIGSGGTGGGGGGGGASANIDGEPFGWFADLDDLWGHGGNGGSSAWGGGTGENGDEGASNGGDDTDASRKYAKAGGTGGSCAAPATVAFFTYKDGDSSNPKVTCTSGHGVTRSGTPLGSLQDFEDAGLADLVSGGTFIYDGKAHGVSVGGSGKLQGQSAEPAAPGAQPADASALSAQAQGDEASSGTVTVDGVQVAWSVAYYDESGAKLDSAPVMPGRYAAVVSLEAQGEEGDVVAPIQIEKRQVAKPEPAALTFECADWATGEGKAQDAFAGLDEADYGFVADAVADDGAASLRSARAAGDYAACFRLTDPETCAWEGEAEGAEECWVPWSISLREFDPNDVTYWGPAYDDETTTVAYTGEPVWVRPWFTYAKDADGRFPAWFTHWGDADRPTTDRDSAVVVYTQGDDDYEGLVGYHENADGSLEKVTGAQVYAWMFGADVDGRHVDVQSGDTVWYKANGDEVSVLAVQAEEPAGADGCVVARDPAYATHLGVRDAGAYHAYAYFDSGAGFAPTALAEADVEVKAAGGSQAAAPATGTSTKASASAAPKTGDLSPLVMGGLATVALLAACALALARARRRD